MLGCKCSSVMLVAAVLWGTCLSTVSEAVPVIIGLEGEVVASTFGLTLGETGMGTITYDDALLTGVGDETLGPLDGLMVDFTIFGQLFTGSDDVDFDSFPTLDFTDGVPVFLDYVVAEASLLPFVPTDIVDPRVLGFSFGFGLIEVAPLVFAGDMFVVEAAVVPEPSAAALFLLTCGLLGYRRHRRTKHASL